MSRLRGVTKCTNIILALVFFACAGIEGEKGLRLDVVNEMRLISTALLSQRISIDSAIRERDSVLRSSLALDSVATDQKEIGRMKSVIEKDREKKWKLMEIALIEQGGAYDLTTSPIILVYKTEKGYEGALKFVYRVYNGRCFLCNVVSQPPN